jgi:deoxycytidylate deaminase
MAKQTITAFVYNKRGRLLAVGNNSYIKTHTLQAQYANRIGKPTAIFLHAEVDALIKASRNGKPHKIFVARYRADGTPALARPCPACMLAIKDFGVKIVEYTVGEAAHAAQCIGEHSDE